LAGLSGLWRGGTFVELVILGGSGAWPKIGQACSGYLVSHHGYRLLIDPGYGVMGELLRYCDPGDLDAVLISHGHPDHCADLNPLLRARVLGRVDHDRLPVVAPRGALDAVLALDPIGAVAAGAEPLYPASGDKINFGPFSVEVGELPHHVTTFGFRITSEDGAVLAYTADSGESSDRVDLALHAGLLLAEVSYPEVVPAEDRSHLSDAAQIARLARDAEVDRCVLTHLMPFADPFRALALVRTAGFEAVELAWPGLTRTIDAPAAAAGLPRRAARKLIDLTDSLPRRASIGW
jgi:ribonuclease BN (tRNA processing enzyme)